MRLINTQTRKFEEFIGDDIPGYAILSHTWGKDEVTYQNYVSGNCQSMEGYAKIDMTCRIAAQNQIGYAWVDTCCIDKGSSAELSEAINSMFRWYQHAVVCYVYLSDLPSDTHWDYFTFAKCRWFTRGWTLQELIAPREMRFFDSVWSGGTWSAFGVHKDRLLKIICSITKIDEKLLLGEQPLSSYPVAQRLSWASKRETTRVEDIAYCLLGLFGINMPLLYGEREKAFRRLQEEILRSTADLSIFAWRLNPGNQGPDDQRMQTKNDNISVGADDTASLTVSGVFARSPAEFIGSGHYEREMSNDLRETSITNIGIKIRCTLLLFKPYQSDTGTSIYFLPLAVSSYGKELGIWLRHIGNHHFLRKNAFELTFCEPEMSRLLPLQDNFLRPDLLPEYRHPGVRWISSQAILKSIRKHTLRIALQPRMRVLEAWPSEYFDKEDLCFFARTRSAPCICIVRVECLARLRTCIIIASDWPLEPKFSVLVDPIPEKALHTIRSIQGQFHEYGYIQGFVSPLLQASGIPHSHFLLEQITEDGWSNLYRINLDENTGSEHRILSIQSSIVLAHEAPEMERSDWFTYLPGEE